MSNTTTYFKYTNSVLIVPMIAVLTMWLVYLIELRLHVNFNKYGVYPRTLDGLRGVFLSPWIHSSIEHLYNNTFPIAILTAALAYFYRASTYKVLVLGVLLSGLITWAIGRPSYHIGASGVIYVLASFIFFKGIFAKYYRLVALSLLVVFIYGSLLWYIFPIKDNISWEGHLAGFLTGLLLAIFIKTPIPVSKKYAWEKEDYDEEEDEFLKHFDADGNFIETKKEDLLNTEETIIKYHYKSDNNDKLE